MQEEQETNQLTEAGHQQLLPAIQSGTSASTGQLTQVPPQPVTDTEDTTRKKTSIFKNIIHKFSDKYSILNNLLLLLQNLHCKPQVKQHHHQHTHMHKERLPKEKKKVNTPPQHSTALCDKKKSLTFSIFTRNR